VTVRVETHDEAVERLLRSREEQGFPRYVEDPTVLDRIAGIVLSAQQDTRQPRRGRKSRRVA
jgi:hypothetical protein